MSAEPAGLQFSVLGPLVVTRAGEQLDFGGTRVKALVATLLIAQGKVVTTDRLLDAIWGEQVPNSGMSTLYSYITRLRKALEPDRPPRAATGLLDRQGPGYVLRVRPESVDSERFAALAEHGARLLSDDPPAAVESLATALALWRGPAYADLGDAEVASAEIARLENARLAARQDHAAARLAMGAAVQAVGELESLVREHPLAERSWELLALALYRSGRQGDALAALRTARERLIEELGVDPGPSLRAMEAAVLRQDPALEQAAAKEAATLAGALGMAGRAVDGAVLLGAVSALGSRVGYSPELMDPLDGPRNVAAVRAALSPEAYDEATAMGASLTKEDTTAMARRLIVSNPGDDGRRTVLRHC